jgi:hypothetical protein
MARFPALICDDDTEKQLPHRWEICGNCRGEGKSSAYLGAYTADEMAQQGPDFREDFISGVYDRQCDPCEGSGKVAVVDTRRCPPDLLAQYREQQADVADMAAMERAERAFGC